VQKQDEPPGRTQLLPKRFPEIGKGEVGDIPKDPNPGAPRAATRDPFQFPL
jgi:hypothetical protein